MRRVLALVLALSAACACQKNAAKTEATPAAPQATASAAPNTALDPALVVGTVNGASVTAGELDKHLAEEMSRLSEEYLTKVHDARKQGLDEMLTDRAIELEAKAQGITKEDVVRKGVTEKMSTPSEAELKEFYDKFVKGKYNVPYEDAKMQIAQKMMEEKQTERAKAFVEEIKKKYNATMSLPLPAIPRVEVAATGPSRGPANAPITIIEFSDFECPFCSRAKGTVDEVMQKYGDKIHLVYRQFPLPFHSHAKKAAEAAICADEQGKFWQMHDKMFDNNKNLTPDELKGYAKGLGLDSKKFDECLDSGKAAATVEKDIADGKKVFVNGTPHFFINGRGLSGAQPIEAFAEIIDAELEGKK